MKIDYALGFFLAGLKSGIVNYESVACNDKDMSQIKKREICTEERRIQLVISSTLCVKRSEL